MKTDSSEESEESEEIELLKEINSIIDDRIRNYEDALKRIIELSKSFKKMRK